MKRINGLSVISAVCKKLHAAFPDVPIYREHIGENFAEPSFFVWSSGVSTVSMVYPRFVMAHQIEVSYFPHHADTDMYEHLLEVGVSLLECLDSIEIGKSHDIVWALSPTYRIVDNNMLQYSAEYRVTAKFQEPVVSDMEIMESHVNNKPATNP